MDFLLSILIFAAMAYFNADKKRKRTVGKRPGSQRQQPVLSEQQAAPRAKEIAKKAEPKSRQSLEDILREVSRQMGLEELQPDKKSPKRPAGQPLMLETDHEVKRKRKPSAAVQSIEKAGRPQPAAISQRQAVKAGAARADSIKAGAVRADNEEKLQDARQDTISRQKALAEGMLWSQILGEPRSRKPYRPLTLK
jgi:hypothetical protein